MMRYRKSDFDDPYRTCVVAEDGTRQEITGDKIVIQLGKDRELVIGLKAHKSRPGQLSITTDSERPPDEKRTHFNVINIHPGACNAIKLSVDRLKKGNHSASACGQENS